LRVATALTIRPPHPSKRRAHEPSPYGPYSLLRSKLVLAHLQPGLELDPDGRSTLTWRGETHELGTLGAEDVTLGRWRSGLRADAGA